MFRIKSILRYFTVTSVTLATFDPFRATVSPENTIEKRIALQIILKIGLYVFQFFRFSFQSCGDQPLCPRTLQVRNHYPPRRNHSPDQGRANPDPLPLHHGARARAGLHHLSRSHCAYR
ncbi:hypothetical protein U2A404270006 [Corynebacterium striatum]|nr:hypothetical protein U2A404270006 [Corynebacterium striatum]